MLFTSDIHFESALSTLLRCSNRTMSRMRFQPKWTLQRRMFHVEKSVFSSVSVVCISSRQKRSQTFVAKTIFSSTITIISLKELLKNGSPGLNTAFEIWKMPPTLANHLSVPLVTSKGIFEEVWLINSSGVCRKGKLRPHDRGQGN